MRLPDDDYDTLVTTPLVPLIDTPPSHSIAQCIEMAPDPVSLEEGAEVVVGGRLTFRNKMGKNVFLRICDPTGRIMIWLPGHKDGGYGFDAASTADIGFGVTARGRLVRDPRGELMVKARLLWVQGFEHEVVALRKERETLLGALCLILDTAQTPTPSRALPTFEAQQEMIKTLIGMLPHEYQESMGLFRKLSDLFSLGAKDEPGSVENKSLEGRTFTGPHPLKNTSVYRCSADLSAVGQGLTMVEINTQTREDAQPRYQVYIARRVIGLSWHLLDEISKPT